MTELDSALPWLLGARVERVDGPTPTLFSLSLYQPGTKQCLLLAVGNELRGVGTSRDRPKGEAASAWVRRLRGKLENARLEHASWLGGDPERATALLLRFARLDGPVELVADFDGKAPALLLLGDEGRIAGSSDEGGTRRRFPDRKAPYTPPGGPRIARIVSRDALDASGLVLLSGEKNRGADARLAQARTTLRTALKRASRKAEAIRGDLARAEQAPTLRREANLILMHLHTIPRGAERIELRDEMVEPAESVWLTLDRAKDARRNAEQRFERARKLERGIAIASQRLADVSAEITRLEARLTDLTSDEPERIEQALAEAGLDTRPRALAPAPRRRPEKRSHVAYRTFLGTGGKRIFVGKGAGDNDTLTLTVARPHDLFLHVRGTPGAHVIVPRDKNAQVAPELLLDAAHLAAHFSSARGETLLEVAHVERRYVRKPKGSPPGSVLVDREKVLLLRVQPERVTRLLAAEQLPK